MIENGQVYTLKPASEKRREYFAEKYGTATPVYRVEAPDVQLFRDRWFNQTGNIGCLVAAMSMSDLPLQTMTGPAYYGHIGGMGEVVLESEIEGAPCPTITEPAEKP